MKKIIAGLFAIAAFTFSVNAQNGDDKKMNRDRSAHHKQGGDRDMSELNLTEAQRQQMKSINAEFKTKMEALRKNENLTVKDSKAQREALMLERKNRVSSILTPEQRTKFQQMGDMRKGDKGEKFGGDRKEDMKDLNLTEAQKQQMKANRESFKAKADAIKNNSSLSDEHKKTQMQALHAEQKESLKSILTAEQLSKIKSKGKHDKGDWKEKRKSRDGKEKIKVS